MPNGEILAFFLLGLIAGALLMLAIASPSWLF